MMTAYDTQQKQIAARIIKVGRRLGASPKALKASLETGIVEAGLRNPKTATDHDSLGTFQQRPSQGWGTPAQVTNVEHAAESFFKRAIPIAQKYGTAGQLAQAVQRSAYPDRYDKAGGSATSLLHELAGVRTMNATAASTSDSSGENAAIDAANEQGRRRALVGQLIAKHNPRSLLLTTGVLNTNFMPQAHVADTPDTPSTTGSSSSSPSGKGKLIVAAGAEKSGKGLQGPLVSFLHDVSAASGRSITVTTGTNHDRLTGRGNVSDHYAGNASDIGVGADGRQDPAALKKGDLIAAHAIQVAGGISFGKALALARQGGYHNFETKRGRVQVIWRVDDADGNHFNHVHIGVAPGR